MATQNARMRQRRGTVSQWESANPVLDEGEIGIATGSGVPPLIKVGDGVTAWNSLTKIMLPEIETGQFSSTPPNFGSTWLGIEREARVFPSGQMMSPSANIHFGDGFPRVYCPQGVTTDVYAIFEVEEWWLRSTIGVYFEWVNDHTTTGDVRFDCSIKECDIGTQTLAAAGVIGSRTVTVTSPAANTATTTVVASVANGNPVSFNPGTLASFYSLRITRLGADAADTLAGPIGIIAASMTRGQ
jgi:hypothetical protein